MQANAMTNTAINVTVMLRLRCAANWASTPASERLVSITPRTFWLAGCAWQLAFEHAGSFSMTRITPTFLSPLASVRIRA